jgi:hypothetical protein
MDVKSGKLDELISDLANARNYEKLYQSFFLGILQKTALWCLVWE